MRCGAQGDYVLPLLQLCGREGVLWLATLVPVAGAGEDPPDMQVVLAETFNLAEQAGRTRLSEVCWAGVHTLLAPRCVTTPSCL